MILPQERYKQVLESMPVLCVDMVIRNDRGEYLLVKRRNAPLQFSWWVPGGRVLKGEGVEAAAKRKCREELNLEIGDTKSVGYYEGHFSEGPFDVPSVHTVSIVLETHVHRGEVTLDEQSEAWKFFKSLPEHFVIRRF